MLHRRDRESLHAPKNAGAIVAPSLNEYIGSCRTSEDHASTACEAHVPRFCRRAEEPRHRPAVAASARAFTPSPRAVLEDRRGRWKTVAATGCRALAVAQPSSSATCPTRHFDQDASTMSLPLAGGEVRGVSYVCRKTMVILCHTFAGSGELFASYSTNTLFNVFALRVLCHALAGAILKTAYSGLFPGVAEMRVFYVCGKQKKLALELHVAHAGLSRTATGPDSASINAVLASSCARRDRRFEWMLKSRNTSWERCRLL